jgi:AraC-like DNA-binding protein
MEEMGLAPWPLFAEVGVDRAVFDSPENVIAFPVLGRLLTLCAARSGCPHLGLLIGERAGIDVLGVVGRLAIRAADLGSALRSIVLYLHLHDRGGVPGLSVSSDRAAFGYTVYQPNVTGADYVYDAALLIASNILKALAGPGLQLSEVCLTRSQPDDIAPYRERFRSRLRFDAEHNAVVFPASWLEHPLGGADVRLHRQIMAEIAALESRSAGDLAAQLQRALRRLLVSGASQRETSMEQISALFGIHRRTLNRRLRARGTSFKALIDAARYDAARQLLRDTRLPVADIAAVLDYAEVSAFGHAFQRWSGTSPAAWRRMQAGGGIDHRD